MSRAESELCVFCGIAEDRVESSKVLEFEKVIAFTSLDGGHPIIIPRLHIRDWTDPNLDQETMNELVVAQRRLAIAVKEVGAEGVTIVSNNGKLAGQEIDHLHIHVIGRTQGDRLAKFERGRRYSRSELDLKALAYREKLTQLGLD